MPTENTGYIQFGVAPDKMSLDIPDVVVEFAHATVPQVEYTPNAENEIISQELGRERVDADTLPLGTLDAEMWWAIGRWLRENGPRFWMRYFDHNVGEWTVAEYYCTARQCTPVVYEGGKPAQYTDCVLSLLDAGGSYAGA